MTIKNANYHLLFIRMLKMVFFTSLISFLLLISLPMLAVSFDFGKYNIFLSKIEWYRFFIYLSLIFWVVSLCFSSGVMLRLRLFQCSSCGQRLFKLDTDKGPLNPQIEKQLTTIASGRSLCACEKV
jgi:hypothetical protein